MRDCPSHMELYLVNDLVVAVLAAHAKSNGLSTSNAQLAASPHKTRVSTLRACRFFDWDTKARPLLNLYMVAPSNYNPQGAYYNLALIHSFESVCV